MLFRSAASETLDDPTLAALLRAEAAARGPAAALARYERHREELADRLGVDPGPLLREVHAELLAADRPIRTGVRIAATALVGRDDDLAVLRSLVSEHRVVTVLGPGGLGKTTLVQLLAREATQPVVHVVELAGVLDPADLLGEIGAAVEVRDSIAGRRVLTPDQRSDLRGRIAQQLWGLPALLVLDNCEHLVDAVADLVGWLVATVPTLRVVTTSRTPLAIAAERVLALARLGDDDAATLLLAREIGRAHV